MSDEGVLRACLEIFGPERMGAVTKDAESTPDDVEHVELLARLRAKRICYSCGAKTRRGHAQCAQCARRWRESDL